MKVDKHGTLKKCKEICKGDFLCFRIVDSYMGVFGPTKNTFEMSKVCFLSQLFKKLRRCLRCSLYFLRCRTSEEMVMEQADFAVRCVGKACDDGG